MDFLFFVTHNILECYISISYRTWFMHLHVPVNNQNAIKFENLCIASNHHHIWLRATLNFDIPYEHVQMNTYFCFGKQFCKCHLKQLSFCFQNCILFICKKYIPLTCFIDLFYMYLLFFFSGMIFKHHSKFSQTHW